jgi:hypothetical protein
MTGMGERRSVIHRASSLNAAICLPIDPSAGRNKEKVDNQGILVEKYPYKNLPAIVFNLFLHSQKTGTSLEVLAERSIDSVAQLVEQYTFNVWVLGSSPSGIT